MKHKTIWIIVLLLCLNIAIANQLVYDSFNRADSDTLGDAEVGGTWNESVNDMDIVSNTAQEGNSGGTAFAYVAGLANMTLPYNVTARQKWTGSNYMNAVGLIITANTNAQRLFIDYFGSDFDPGIRIFKDGYTLQDSTLDCDTSENTYFVITAEVLNESQMNFYIDGSNCYNWTGYDGSYLGGDVGIISDVGGGYSGLTDWFEVNDTSGVIDSLAPVITFGYPGNGVVNNSWNRSVIFETNEAANTTVNDTDVSLITAESTETYHVYNYTGTLFNQTYTFNFSAWDASDNNRTETFTFTYDTVLPVDTFSASNNDSVVYDRFTFQLNLTDDRKLFSLNITTSNDYLNYTDNINQTSYIFNGSIDVSNFAIGEHLINYTYCDAHTDKEIKDYKTKIDSDFKIEYEDKGKKFSVKPKDPNKFNDAKTTKKTDRYLFEFDKKDPTSLETYIVEAEEEIHIIGDESYQGWLVLPHSRKWIDFQTASKDKATIKKINDRTIEVTTRGYNFESVGDLNCDNATYKFYKWGYTHVFTPLVLELTDTTVTLIINKTGISDTLLSADNITSNLIYNNTLYNVTKTNSTNYVNFSALVTSPDISISQVNVPLYYNFSLLDVYYNSTQQTQIVSIILFDDCTLAGNVTATLNILKENFPTENLTSSLQGYVTYWADPEETQNATIDLSGAAVYNLCLDSGNQSIYANVYLQYTPAVSGFTHRFILYNHTFNYTTQNLSIYNFNTTSGLSDLEATIRKSTNYNYFPNVVTSLQRFYPAENVWRTVQMDQSGDFGLVFFNVIEENTDYRFIFRDRFNNVLKTTESMKLVCDPVTIVCDLTFLLNEYSSSTSNAILTVVANLDNVTNILQANWTNPTGLVSQIRSRVTKETGSSTTEICNIIQTGSAGTANCNVSGYQGSIWLSVYKTASPETPSFVKQFLKSREKIGNLLSVGESALWSAGIMITMVMFGVAVSPLSPVIILVFGMIVLWTMGLLSALNLATLTIVMVMAIAIGIKVKR